MQTHTVLWERNLMDLFWKILTVAYCTWRNHVFGLYQSSYVSKNRAPVWWLRLALSKGPNRVDAAIILPEEETSSFQNVVFFRNIRRWTKSKNMIPQNLIEWTAWKA
jgi:hypothetical protein